MNQQVSRIDLPLDIKEALIAANQKPIQYLGSMVCDSLISDPNWNGQSIHFKFEEDNACTGRFDIDG